MQLLGPFSAQHSLRQSSSTFARTSGIFLLSDHQLAVLCLKNGQKTRLVSKDCNFTIFYHISPISNSFTHFSLSSSGITYQKNTKIAILDDVPSPRKDFNSKNWECLGVPNDPKWKVHTVRCAYFHLFSESLGTTITLLTQIVACIAFPSCPWLENPPFINEFPSELNLQTKFRDVRYAIVGEIPFFTKPYKIPLNHRKSQ